MQSLMTVRHPEVAAAVEAMVVVAVEATVAMVVLAVAIAIKLPPA